MTGILQVKASVSNDVGICDHLWSQLDSQGIDEVIVLPQNHQTDPRYCPGFRTLPGIHYTTLVSTLHISREFC